METHDLQMKPGGVPLIIHTSQFDTDREYTFIPYYGADKYAYQSGSTCVVEATKSDGFVVIEKPTYNSDGTIYYKPSAELTNAAGDAHLKVRIVSSSSNLTIASTQVTFAVDKAGIQPEAKLSSSDISILEEGVAQLNSKVSAAATYASNAASSATAAKTSETNAKSSQTAAAASATNAKTSETNAKSSQTAAAASATNAKTSETNAKSSQTAAATSATNAKTSETNAKSSQTAAATSATNAKTSETNAKNWAVGPSGSGSGTDTNNAKYYAEQAAKSAEQAAAGGVSSLNGLSGAITVTFDESTGDIEISG